MRVVPRGRAVERCQYALQVDPGGQARDGPPRNTGSTRPSGVGAARAPVVTPTRTPSGTTARTARAASAADSPGVTGV
ncbi:hypothetical protein [Streptomyces sp. bgisy082]|uniref:hypothetical protein n=1 Tax=Streptomyces sp. bgisy082 TaxID=3413776 RepID=UPI003D709DA6